MTDPQPFTVNLDPGRSTSSFLQRAVLATVPNRFLVTQNGPADVVVVSGDHPHWPDVVAEAVDGGSRGVVIVDPGFVEPGRVATLARAVDGRAVVGVETTYADDRTWTAVREEVVAAAATASIVDSLVYLPDDRADDRLVPALISQLAVVRPLVDSLESLRLLHRGAREYVLEARTSGPHVSLAGVKSANGSVGLALDVVESSRRWEIRFDQTALGGATMVTSHDATGAHTRPLVHESGRRMTWLRLHRALTGNGEIGYSLDDLARDLALAGAVMPEF